MRRWQKCAVCNAGVLFMKRVIHKAFGLRHQIYKKYKIWKEMLWTNLLKQFKDFQFWGFFIYQRAVTTHNSPFSLSSQTRSHPAPFLFQPQLSFLVRYHLCMESGKQKNLSKVSCSSQAAKLLSSAFKGWDWHPKGIPRVGLLLQVRGARDWPCWSSKMHL